MKAVRLIVDSIAGALRPVYSDANLPFLRLGGFAEASDDSQVPTLGQVKSAVDSSKIGSTRFLILVGTTNEIQPQGETMSSVFEGDPTEQSTQGPFVIKGVILDADKGNTYTVRVVDTSDPEAGIIVSQTTSTLSYHNWEVYFSFVVKAADEGDPDPFEGEYPIEIEVINDDRVVASFIGSITYPEE